MKNERFLTLLACGLAALLGACGGDHHDEVDAVTDTTLSVVKPTATCASLTTLDLTDIGGVGSVVSSATETTSTLNGASVKFCTVQGTLAPTVGFRVSLPVDSWTQRSLHMGCGGLCGNVSTAVEPGQAWGCPLTQSGGFVLSATDMGHSGMSSAWTLDAQKRVDFAYRGVHITTLAAKKLIRAYYGQDQKRGYFVGCSDGGREALMAAQRYPGDYDGIIAGAPAFHFQIQNSLHHAWLSRSNRDTGLSTGAVVLLPAKATVLHNAVMAACDALDGQTDGLLTDPRRCSFEPATIQCAAGATDTSTCLTASEVTAASRIYAGPRDPVSSRRILAGGPQYGSEKLWAGVFLPASATATNLFSDTIVANARNLIFTDATPPTIDEFEFTETFLSRLRPRHPLNDSTNPDLRAFQAAGGKLILWHGWADQHISPSYTVAYHEAMVNTMGQTQVDAFSRTYLVPGVGHCGGGDGHPNMDLVSKIVDWVEKGTAPEAITTVRTGTVNAVPNTVTSARPVYPYPAVARYDGTGDVHAVTSYGKGPALTTATTADWAASDWFTPFGAAPL